MIARVDDAAATGKDCKRRCREDATRHTGRQPIADRDPDEPHHEPYEEAVSDDEIDGSGRTDTADGVSGIRYRPMVIGVDRQLITA